MKSLEEEFKIQFFKENGFKRKRCESCGTHYWTQNPESDNCGDTPCREYTFINNPPARRRLTLNQFRDLFLKYFEKENHTIIRPYPVIARWRDDVYLVGASIYNFQPYVTEGSIPPPANPLVISQPCIRFTDIDKVGQTLGRHMTIFEMGGAHAFNYENKEVYWKDETLRLHHSLLTEELGVKSEEVNYKEDFWSGGGNAGPDLEACVAGLEISTLVFMMYKHVGDELVKTPIRTVDTGYGIERWTWLSQGSPSGFHATYGPLLDTISRMAGLKIDDRIIAENSRVSSKPSIHAWEGTLLNVKIAENLGLSSQEVSRTIEDFQNLCTALDHTKALCFILSEGIVPSNMQVGYLARLLVRRTYRALKDLGVEAMFLDLVERQIEYWSNNFPNLKVMEREILEELKIELEKYKRTVNRGISIVRKISREVKEGGLREIPQEVLIRLYDSHGLIPEMVREFAETEAVTVKIPEDFFGMVAKRHLQAKPVEEVVEKDIIERVSNQPKTVKLYYQNPYMKEFEAKVLDVVDNRYIILDQTIFYSAGGGQLSDIGEIVFDEGSLKVVDVKSVGETVLHAVEGRVPPVGSKVRGVIDWDRRLSLMRHHTSTHILIGAVRRVLGEHAWQAGAAKDVETSRLDISHYRHITTEEVDEIEKLASEVIAGNIPVETLWMLRDEAEREYGYRIYQGGAVPGTVIRIVKIGDWDIEACGGTHVRSTGEVGIIKILRTERIQDGVERITFAAGPHVLKEFRKMERQINELSRILNSPAENLVKTTLKLLEDLDKTAKKVERLREELTTIEAETLLGKAKRIDGLKLIISRREDGEDEDMIMLGSKVARAEPKSVTVILLVKGTVKIYVFAGKEAKGRVDAGKIAGELAAIVGGGGGGRDYFGQGGGTETDRVEDVLDATPKIVRRQMRRK
ncbi:MAG: alanine--tRNA ligase [Candidatus Bathyarchaeia archaeon]